MSGYSDELSIPKEMEESMKKDGFKPRWMNTQARRFNARVNNLKAKPVEGFDSSNMNELKLMKIPLRVAENYRKKVQEENAEALESVISADDYARQHQKDTGKKAPRDISFQGVPKPVSGNITQQRAKGRAMAFMNKTIPAFEKQ